MDEYMDIWEDERLNEDAVRLLVQRHRGEYDELRQNVIAARISELEETVRGYLRKINELQAQNPDGLSVPPLIDSANLLMKKNDELGATIAKMKKDAARLARENDKLREIIGKERTGA